MVSIRYRRVARSRVASSRHHAAQNKMLAALAMGVACESRYVPLPVTSANQLRLATSDARKPCSDCDPGGSASHAGVSLTDYRLEPSEPMAPTRTRRAEMTEREPHEVIAQHRIASRSSPPSRRSSSPPSWSLCPRGPEPSPGTAAGFVLAAW